MTVHPIEAESYRILADRVDLSSFGPLARAVVGRVVHASADPEYAHTLVAAEADLAAAVDALRAGAVVVTDVEMVRHGITGVDARCYLPPAGEPALRPGGTRSAEGMRRAAARHTRGAVFVVGCAPTALAEVVGLVQGGHLRPALVVGLPVGFVGAAEAKAAARASGLPTITNVGEKGGSAAAAGALNAIVRLAGAGEVTGA